MNTLFYKFLFLSLIAMSTTTLAQMNEVNVDSNTASQNDASFISGGGDDSTTTSGIRSNNINNVVGSSSISDSSSSISDSSSSISDSSISDSSQITSSSNQGYSSSSGEESSPSNIITTPEKNVFTLSMPTTSLPQEPLSNMIETSTLLSDDGNNITSNITIDATNTSEIIVDLNNPSYYYFIDEIY
jgi:hypothetical protein